MIILASRKIIDFENSANDGRMLCTLLPTKGIKTPVKLIHAHTFIGESACFYLKFIPLLEFDYYSDTKPLKAISIETS